MAVLVTQLESLPDDQIVTVTVKSCSITWEAFGAAAGFDFAWWELAWTSHPKCIPDETNVKHALHVRVHTRMVHAQTRADIVSNLPTPSPCPSVCQKMNRNDAN